MIRVLLLALVLILLARCDRVEQEINDGFFVSDDTIIETVDEFDVPWDDSRSRDPFVAPDGTIFFVGQRGDYIGMLDPASGEFTRFDLDEGTRPHTVVVTPDGTPWYAGNRARHIGKLDPESGEITKIEMEHRSARDPHSIAIASDGNLWFTTQSGNGVCHFNITTSETTVIEVSTRGARPYGIVMDRSGERPWIALFGTNKLATVDPESMELEEIDLPRDEIRPRRLDVTSDGNVWYGDYESGFIGRYNPSDGTVAEWEMPGGAGSRPYAIVADDRDRIWISASGLNPNKLLAFDTRSEAFVASQDIPTAQGALRHMVFHEPTRSIWFGTDTGHIGRAVIN